MARQGGGGHDRILRVLFRHDLKLEMEGVWKKLLFKVTNLNLSVVCSPKSKPNLYKHVSKLACEMRTDLWACSPVLDLAGVEALLLGVFHAGKDARAAEAHWVDGTLVMKQHSVCDDLESRQEGFSHQHFERLDCVL